MENVIVVFPKPEDGKNIKNILVKNGITVDAVCTSGAQALEYVNQYSEGIVVCSYRFTDMLYTELLADLPKEFEMLLVASETHWVDDAGDAIIRLGMPIKVYDLLNTIHMMFEAQARRRKKARQKPKIRTEEEKEIIKQAKTVLIERNHMTEDEAHKYLLRTSMEGGHTLVETAHMVITLYRG